MALWLGSYCGMKVSLKVLWIFEEIERCNSELFISVSFVSQMEMPAEIQRKIYTELHRDIESTYGKKDVGQRMGLLLCMLQDLDVSSLSWILL